MRFGNLLKKLSCKPKMERREDGSDGHWIAEAVSHPGALHEELHISKRKKIPLNELKKATHARSPLERKRANLAITLRGFHRGRH